MIATVVGIALLNHIGFAGGRVAITIAALHDGATPLTLGLLMSCIGLLPMLTAVAVGRLSDRIGTRRPLIIGTLLVAVGVGSPSLVGGLGGLYMAVVFGGLGHQTWQIAIQHWVGSHAPAGRRVQWFTLLAFGVSFSNLIGPVLAGFALDGVGVRSTFLILALFPMLALVILKFLPVTDTPRVARDPAARKGAWSLMEIPRLARLLAASTLVAVAWDLHSFVVPILGVQRGFSSSTIGLVLGMFGAATILVRAGMPWLSRRLDEWAMVRTAVAIALCVYALYPFAPNVPLMIALSFALGLGLGACQPNVLALLNEVVPPGRIGEAVGLRMTLGQASQVILPVAFGSAGFAVGIAPIFWTMAAALGAGSWFLRTPDKSV